MMKIYIYIFEFLRKIITQIGLQNGVMLILKYIYCLKAHQLQSTN